MKPKKKAISLLLAICLVAGLMPTVAFATGSDKAIQLGAGGISGYSDTNSYDYIYYGTWNDSPIKWRVLDTKTNMANVTEGGGLFLLSDVLLGTGTSGDVYFDRTGRSNAWQGSDAQAWCKDFAGEEGAGSTVADAFTANELGAILATTKSDSAYTISGEEYGVSSLSGDKVFLLSAEEADNDAYGFRSNDDRTAYYDNSPKYWWLRSPHAGQAYSAGVVLNYGRVDYTKVDGDYAARPAFNLDLDSVLFTSAATSANGGKVDDTVDNSLTAVENYTGNEWKLTLLDSSRESFSISNATTNSSDNTIEFSYSNAQTGKNEYISVVIEDKGEITHYGRILQLDGTTGGASGTASLTLPDGVTLGGATKLYVFNEQYNGDKMTDYASQPCEVQFDTTPPGADCG